MAGFSLKTVLQPFSLPPHPLLIRGSQGLTCTQSSMVKLIIILLWKIRKSFCSKYQIPQNHTWQLLVYVCGGGLSIAGRKKMALLCTWPCFALGIKSRLFSWTSKALMNWLLSASLAILPIVSVIFYTQPFTSTGSVSMDSTNCKCFPEISKKQNLNFPCTGSYLHCIR